MLFALLVLAAVTLLVMQAGRPGPPEPLVGLALPPLEVDGWLNTEGPLTAGDLRGQVVLVNFWSTSCPTCVVDVPNLVEFYEKFHDQGLTIVGLTPETATLGYLEQFVESAPGLEWPIGYGAGFVFELMSIPGTPTYILYDRTGRSVWAGHSLDGLEDAAIAALAAKSS